MILILKMMEMQRQKKIIVIFTFGTFLAVTTWLSLYSFLFLESESIKFILDTYRFDKSSTVHEE